MAQISVANAVTFLDSLATTQATFWVMLSNCPALDMALQLTSLLLVIWVERAGSAVLPLCLKLDRVAHVGAIIPNGQSLITIIPNDQSLIIIIPNDQSLITIIP